MKKSIHHYLVVFGLPMLLLAFLIILVNSSIFQTNPAELSIGVTLDFIITIPLIYFLLIRKKEIPKITVASVFVVCVLLASVVLPMEHQNLLTQIKIIAIPLVELCIVGFVLMKARRIIGDLKKNKNQAIDFFDALKVACSAALPSRIGNVLATEIAVVHYAFNFLGKKEKTENEFTYFNKSGIKATVWVFIMLIFVETGVTHLLVERWNVTVAWVLTFLSLYTCLQVFALLRSMDHRLISINEEKGILNLKYGFFNQAVIKIREIEQVEINRRSLPEDKSIVQFSPLGMLDTHNIIIRLKSEHVLNRIYGLEKKYTAIAIYVDDKERFVEEINKVI